MLRISVALSLISAGTIWAGECPGTKVAAGTLVMNQKNLPAFCRVEGILRPSADSEIKYEVWLPEPDKWNGKFYGVGNGGYAGSIGYGGLAEAVRSGYAAASTDTGHSSVPPEPKWAMKHPEKVIDFGHRAIHEMTVAGKSAVNSYYGSAPKRSYFNSCSNGGRQALMEAQKYPEDYDGIIAGAPANAWTKLMANAVQMSKTMSEAYLPAAKLPAVQDLSVKGCGADEGVVEMPPACKVDYSKLECSGTESAQCLTAPQLRTLSSVYGGLKDKKGRSIYPGYSPGVEAGQGGWGPWITGTEPEKSLLYYFGVNWYRYFVYDDPEWDHRKFDAERDLKAAQLKWAKHLDSTDPDLSRFHKRGGKLILYHGWSDAAIPAQATVDYYEAVKKKMGQKKAAEFVRLYMVPGMQHCGGGPGPAAFGQGGVAKETPATNIAAAMEAWVEQGTAPGEIQGKTPAGKMRPLTLWK